MAFADPNMFEVCVPGGDAYVKHHLRQAHRCARNQAKKWNMEVPILHRKTGRTWSVNPIGAMVEITPGVSS